MGVVSASLPSINPEGTEKQLRLGRHGDLCMIPLYCGNNGVCNEGSYYTAANPTPGTAIVFAVNNAVSETAGYYFAIRNSDAAGGRRIVMDFIRLIQGVVPASGNAGHYFLKIDTNMVTTAASTLVAVNNNGDAGNASVAQVYAGANTTAARTSAARTVDRGVLRSVIPVLNDEWIFKFGGVEAAGPSSLGGTVALRMPIPCPPVIVGPGQSLGLQLWFPSNASTAAQFEIEAGWCER
jgi:hypothetical protein